MKDFHNNKTPNYQIRKGKTFQTFNEPLNYI